MLVPRRKRLTTPRRDRVLWELGGAAGAEPERALVRTTARKSGLLRVGCAAKPGGAIRGPWLGAGPHI